MGRYIDHYKFEPRIVNFFSMASGCGVHGEMLVTALGTPWSTPDDTEHYRPGFTDNVNMAMRILTEAVDAGLLIRGEFKPTSQQRFFGVDGGFGRDVKPPRNDGEMFSHSILYQYRGDKAKIYAHFEWTRAACSLTPEAKDTGTMIEPTWLSSHAFLSAFWQGQSLDPAALVRFRRPGQHDGWLEAIQGRMTADNAIDDSTAEIVRCLAPCVCGELLVNLAVYLRDAGYNILEDQK